MHHSLSGNAAPLLNFFHTLYPIFLGLVLAFILFIIIKGIIEWFFQNKQPVVNVSAKVVSKRTQVIHHFHEFETHLYFPISTFYFATFECVDGGKVELEMGGVDFIQMNEGDFGMLSFRGNEFYQFIPLHESLRSKEGGES